MCTDTNIQRKVTITESQTCNCSSWASIASRRRSQWSNPNTLLLSLRSMRAEKRGYMNGCTHKSEEYIIMLLNLQTSVKKFLGMFCMSVCSVIVPLSHVLHAKTKVQALRDNIGDRANRKVIRSVWQYGDGRRGGGGYVTQLSRKPRPLSKPNWLELTINPRISPSENQVQELWKLLTNILSIKVSHLAVTCGTIFSAAAKTQSSLSYKQSDIFICEWAHKSDVLNTKASGQSVWSSLVKRSCFWVIKWKQKTSHWPRQTLRTNLL